MEKTVGENDDIVLCLIIVESKIKKGKGKREKRKVRFANDLNFKSLQRLV